MESGLDELRAHFRDAFRSDPVAAYREWFRLQEDLRERNDTDSARALAEDFWALLDSLSFASDEERARFFHNAGVFFGTPGPAADLARAREGFSIALVHFAEPEETGWHARVLHNFATSLSNLGETREDLLESVELFERALAWRTSEREIARGVTLHNLGIALRRLARHDPEGEARHLDQSADRLREACAIRNRYQLAEGHALSLFHLGLTLEALRHRREARLCFQRAAEEFDSLGKRDSAAIARDRIAENEREGEAI